jgi:parallel beta-helix repeat protein
MNTFTTISAYTPTLRLAIAAVAMALGVSHLHAATYIVGSCKSGDRFSTIQAALDAASAGSTVEVCPGQYLEQVTITKPVTLQGISANNGALVQILLPASYAKNVTLNAGSGVEIPAVAQVHVDKVSGGPVNLENVEVNGVGVGQNANYFVGIFYEDSSGTMNQVVAASQNDNENPNPDVFGFGMWIQGGSSKPSVTVQNSSIRDFSIVGIHAVGPENELSLNLTLSGNNISSPVNTAAGIELRQGTNPTISGNVVSGSYAGMYVESTAGSIAGNTILGSDYGILLEADGTSIKSNRIYNAVYTGILLALLSPSLKVSQIEDNTVASINLPGSSLVTGEGINLNCKSVSSSNVNSNTLIDVQFGYRQAPRGFGANNSYAGVFEQVAVCQ